MTPSLLDAIGNTPMVEIKRLNPHTGIRIFAKLEYFNPGGSIKDRAAYYMITAGERSGQLTPGKTVIEATSGNTGIGLALVCAVRGYRLLLTMSESASAERQKILRARGADILLTPGHLSTDGAIEEAYRLARENPDLYFLTDQFNNPANWRAHYETTAVEIWEQTAGAVDAVVATMGTTGTLMGLQRRLKEFDNNIQIIGIEPYRGHKLQGLKNMTESYSPEIYEKARLDRKLRIDDEEAFEMTRRLAREEGLFVGMSSGAAMAGALAAAEQLDTGTIVTIFPDSGERYLSTPLFAVQETANLRLFNTVARRKEVFAPQQPGKVNVFCCGPAVDGRLGIAEYRRFMATDLLHRYLKYRGFAVNLITHITDLDDRTIEASRQAQQELKPFCERNIGHFLDDLKTLGIAPSGSYPRTSEHAAEMIAMAEQLMDKGVAYEKLRSLYFNISRCPEYGRLSGINLNKIRLGVTVDLDAYEKDNPRDFTLLKRSRLSELKRGIYLRTRWGNVRPSWHLQSAAVAMKYLGAFFDVHIGSRDLIFPHNENEMAIARCLTDQPLARFWIHCDRLSTAKPGVFDSDMAAARVPELVAAGHPGRVLRYWLLLAHYRKPLNCNPPALESARRGLERLDGCLHSLRMIQQTGAYGDLDQLLYDLKHGFNNAMEDDLNISAAMAVVFKSVRNINILQRDRLLSSADAARILDLFASLNQVLNIFDFEDRNHDPEIADLLAARQRARRQHDWQTADALRDKLIAMGVAVQDTKLESQ